MISWVLWLACAGETEDAALLEPSEKTEPKGAAPVAPKEPANTTIDTKWAWPAAGGGTVAVPGNILGTTGITTAAGAACGPNVKVDTGFVFATVPAAPVSYPAPPPNQAATLERAAWRLSDALGPRVGIVPGVSTVEAPSRQMGVNVRTLRKTRRPNGPPLLFAVGSRDGKVAVVLLDSEAAGVVSSDVFEWKGTSRLEVSSIVDVDGDGRLEVFVGADDPTGGLRASWRVDLAESRITRASLATSPAMTCP